MRRLAGKHGVTIAIIALLVLNVVLIAPLLLGRNAVPESADAAPSSAGTEGTTQMASPSPSPDDDSSASPSPSAALVSGKPRRLLAVNSDQVAWRADAAGCGEKSRIEVTTDGGKTWQTTDSGLRSVVRLRAFGDASVFAIGADEHCKPTYSVDAYPGAEWQSDDSMLAETWFRLPINLNAVHDPHNKISHPCGPEGVVDLAGRGDDQAAVLCGDSSIRVRDGGDNWRTAVQKSDALALNADDNRFVMAVTASGCGGPAVQKFTVDGDHLKTRKAHCLDVPESDPDHVAVSIHGGSTWLWSGDRAKHEA